MIVSDFYSSVRGALQRGSSQDAMLPLWASEACSLIEQEWSYGWMNRTGTTAVSASAMVPNQVAFPNARVKSFDFVKILNPQIVLDGQRWNGQPELVGVDPKDVIGIGSCVPEAFWLDGVSYLYLDANTPVDITLFMGWNEFTSWPSDTSQEPAILIRATSLMICTTLAIAAQRLKDPRMEDQYTGFAKTAQQAARAADTELKYKHQNNMAMTYVPAG